MTDSHDHTAHGLHAHAAEGAPANPVLAEIWRGDILECSHRGAVAVCNAAGELVAAWGHVERVHLPRSACKMIQALPLVDSGAADAAGLDDRHLALACASHGGAEIHTRLVADWLAGIGLDAGALGCGVMAPDDAEMRKALRAQGAEPTPLHHMCSGKHTGFLTLARHLGADRGEPDYLDPASPVQQGVRDALAEVSDEEPQGPAIDGCSAPNFGLTLKGMATAMARFADPAARLTGRRAEAASRLAAAMAAHPLLIGYKASSATLLTEASAGATATKSGAEGGFVAILPEKGLGVAVKVDDGGDRGAAAAMAAVLARLGLLDRESPAYRATAEAPIRNFRGTLCGHVCPGPALM
ncbi:asparaginase [Paralimibaculum aggregatum]|uniref:Asparaginase n=1 Tax=Paralimibaculum aggregatum TaxID=3036245 RepID=A0ABQ6LK50_9RHOB|nr:asparaginase [Limibaculum sp. NKW23]GMG82057.1 asparaginase [Limibaculum sp. NKW23]